MGFYAIAALFVAHASFGQQHSMILRFGIRNDVTTLNPFVNTAAQDHDLRTLIYEPLLLQDKSYQVRPYLAEAWEISKNGLVYTFTLRKDVVFHNGKALLSEDVRWSTEYGQDPKNLAYGGDELRSIVLVETPDPHRVRITLGEPMASFLPLMTTVQTLPILPKESLRTAERPQAFPPGTGPYRFQQWKTGQELVVTRSQNYWQKRIPRLDQVEFKIILDSDARFMALRAGALEVIEKMPPQHVSGVQKGEFPEVRLALAEGSGLQGLIFNTRKPPFDNIKMRQMVAYAVDPADILRAAYWGVGSVVNQKMLPASPWYFPIPERKRDLPAARRLLREAGYGPGFRMRLSGGQQAERQLTVVQSQLREAGVEADLQLMDPASHRASLRKGDWECSATGGYMFFDPDPNYFSYFHTEVVREGRATSIRNVSGYSNAQADLLLEEGRKTLDPHQRHRIYREFVELIHREVPVLYYLISPSVFAYRPELKGFEVRDQGQFFTGDTGIPFSWIER